jgi:hypothetical protein
LFNHIFSNSYHLKFFNKLSILVKNFVRECIFDMGNRMKNLMIMHQKFILCDPKKVLSRLRLWLSNRLSDQFDNRYD